MPLTALTNLLGFKERGRSVPAGEWITPTFNAGTFTGSGSMTWTVDAGDVVTFAYMLVGKTMWIQFSLGSTTVGGTPGTALYITIPGGFTAAKQYLNPVRIIDNGADGAGFAYVAMGGTTIAIQKFGSAPYSASTNNTTIQGQLVFEIL